MRRHNWVMLPGLVLSAGVTPVPPNIVLIFCDDLGYGDLSCYGNRSYKTPNIDHLAAEGMRFTDFYTGSPACTPSRASLLTGCYPTRVGLPQVLGPNGTTGLNPQETNLANMLKERGYATACVGKWHLGVKNLLPTNQGFDQFYGLPYSHDMWPPNGDSWPRLFFHEGNRESFEIRDLTDQSALTERYTKFSTEFIKNNKNQPFFLYLAHSMPHVPIAASKRFLGKSGRGLYADVVQEIDWSVGEVVKALKESGVDANTLVMFSSDNGPWLPYGDHAGSPGPFREGKGTTFEAGLRVPGIFRWPGKIPAGQTSREMVSTMDVLPTVAKITGGTLSRKPIDGHDIRPLLFGEPEARTPWKWFFYYWPDELQAVRSGKWKLHVPHSHRHQTLPAGTGGKPAGEVTARIGLSLFDLEADPGETTNVADQHPDVVSRLMRMIKIGRRELGDSLTQTVGSGVRSPGLVQETG